MTPGDGAASIAVREVPGLPPRAVRAAGAWTLGAAIFLAVHPVDTQFSMYWAFGLAFGFVLQRGRFCFASAFRDLFLLGHGRTMKGVLMGLAVASVGFGLVMSRQVPMTFLGINPPSANVLPLGVHTALGGVLFGVGMVLAGGCVSGSLYRMGEGYVGSWVAFGGLMVGLLVSAHQWNWWWETSMAAAPRLWLPRWLGHPGALAVTLLGLALTFVWVLAVEHRAGVVVRARPEPVPESTTVGDELRALSHVVFLHGCADAHDHWFVSDRQNLHSSPAIHAASRQALAMAGQPLEQIALFDLYSCFASAVEIGCREIGLAEHDERGLTVTGGLPYFGGPGNNYVTHSISEMMRRLRARPGQFGLVTANGNYVTKHAFGVYSTAPVLGAWQREDPARLQAQLDALPKAPFNSAPHGAATVETYTVMHGRGDEGWGPQFAVLFGRLAGSGERFIANLPDEPALLHALQNQDSLGRAGQVHRGADGRNLFTPDR
jgi:uncharacterized membrane protein YedE/YeeE